MNAEDEWEIKELPVTEEDLQIIERNKNIPRSDYVSYEALLKGIH